MIPFAETHVMEHGLYVLEGKAVYRLNQDWVEVQEGDFMWLRAFCPQACYSGGPGRFRYLLYKDVNGTRNCPASSSRTTDASADPDGPPLCIEATHDPQPARNLEQFQLTEGASASEDEP